MTQYRKFGRVSVTHLLGGEDVVIPTWCLAAEMDAPASLELSVSAQMPLSALSLNSPDYVYLRQVPVSGSALTLSLQTEEAFSRGPLLSYGLFARGSHLDGTSEVGAIFDLANDATSASINLHPALAGSISVSVLGGPAQVPAEVFVSPTRGLDVLAFSEGFQHGASSSNWGAQVPVFGLEYATGIVSAVRFSNGYGSYREVAVSTSNFDPVIIQASLLPPLVTLPPAFFGSALQWTIASPGASDLGIISVASGGFDQYFFPPNICESGDCRLRLPPFPPDRAGPTFPAVSSGIWYLTSTNAPSSYPGSILGVLTRAGEPGIRRESGSSPVLSY